MLVTMENVFEYRLHGITILDENGEPMGRVQRFDTETMEALCIDPGTKENDFVASEYKRTAADYVIFFDDELHRQWLEANLPDAAMREHFQPIPTDEVLPPLPEDECIDNSSDNE